MSKYLRYINLFYIIVGYFLLTSLFSSKISNGDSQSITLPIRLFGLSLSLIVIYLNISTKNYLKIDRWYILLSIFIFMYLIRMIYDLIIDGSILHYFDKSFYFANFLFICLLPMYSLRNSIDIDSVIFVKILLLFYVLAGLLSLLNNSISFSSVVVDRIDGNDAFGSIGFGHAGVSLSLLSVYLIVKRNKFIPAYFGLIFGFFLVLISGSRSPIIAFFVATFIFFASRIGKSHIILSLLLVLFLIFLTNFETFLSFVGSFNASLEKRFYLLIVAGDYGAREVMYNTAFSTFLDYPLTGYSFLLQSGFNIGTYPHNFFLESLMACGLLGGLIFAILNFAALYFSIISFKFKNSFFWVNLLYIQFLILGMFSGAIWNSPLYWVFLFLVFNTRNRNIHQQIV